MPRYHKIGVKCSDIIYEIARLKSDEIKKEFVYTLSPLQQIYSRITELNASLPDHVTLHRDGNFHIRMRKRKGKGGLDAEGRFDKNVVDEVVPNRAIRFIYHTVAPTVGGYPLPLMNVKNDEIALAVIEPVPVGVALFLVGEQLDVSAYLRSFPSVAQNVLFRPPLLPAFEGVNILMVFCARPFMPAADMPSLDHNEHRLTEFVAFPSREFLEGRDWSASRSHNYVWQATTHNLIQQGNTRLEPPKGGCREDRNDQ